MSAPTDLKLLRSIKTGKGLLKLVKNLIKHRRDNKVPNLNRSVLSKKQRELVLAKTEGHCHICGIELDIANFQADHVKAHISGGSHSENNYLPSCSTCNNYRWHYSSEELQIIIKLGVWAKTKITSDPSFGLQIANEFVKHEMHVRRRRKGKQMEVEE